MHPNIASVYRVGVVEGVMGELFFGGLPYFTYWKNDQYGILRASYLIGLI